MDLVYGIDVSFWEPSINWQTLRDQGVRFAFIRATSGENDVDSLFKTHWEGAKQAGILRGAYHYLIATQDPVKQANLFIRTLGSDPGELPPTIDLEDKYNEHASRSQIIAACKTMLDRVEQEFGRKPMIYSRRTYLYPHATMSNGRPPAWAKNYPLWVAQYPYVFSADTMPNKNMPQQPDGWHDWKFWQYSERGLIEGVTDELGRKTGCDLNWFRGTEAQLLEFAGVKPQEPSEYIVKSGDTVKSIADQYHMTVEQILNFNPDLLKEGMRIKIPGSQGPAPSNNNSGDVEPLPKTHTVKPGENLTVIAAQYGVTVDRIKAVNPMITNPDLIEVGQVIVIP